LAVVFIVSLFDNPPKSDDKPPEASEKVNEISSDVTSNKSGSTTSADTVSGDENTVNTTPAPLDDNIDNEWAMYLVNSKNPLPADYDDRLETTIVYTDTRDYYLDNRAAPYLLELIDDAAADGVDLLVVSTYRSQEYQKGNFERSVADRMANGMDYDTAYADTLLQVTLPGYSEHNAGLAADIMSPEYTSMDDDGFKNTEAFAWLSENAADYGFILRYPENKQDITGIIYEPWHYRFVGVYYAKEITERGITLEEYFAENGWLDESGKAIYHLGPIGEVPEGAEQNYPEPDPNAITVTVATASDPIVV
jgi:D-alanyl-D-alanine carboxypeptidase